MTEQTHQDELSAHLLHNWDCSCRKLEDLAEAIPPDKFESAPVEGIRTVAEVLRHVACWHRHVANSLSGRETDNTGNELSAAEYATKATIFAALCASSAEVSAQLKQRVPLEPKEVELVMPFIEHTSEHYGQLAVYARWMGIVPPASRP